MKIRNMREEDVPAAMRLKEIAGWNQTAADWKRFLAASPRGCFVADIDKEVRGTVTTICFEARFAWVGMVLVDPQYRGRGIGTRLLERAIEYLDEVKIPSVKLDATPQGKPLYEKLGFVTEYEIERWTLTRSAPESAEMERPGHFSPAELPSSLLEFDRMVFGADRSDLLRSLHEDAPDFTYAIWNNQSLQGYALGRHGSFADHLGPWIANDRQTAEVLLKNFLARSGGAKIIVDSLKRNVMTRDLLSFAGFAVARPLTRMYRGVNDHPGRTESVCAIMGPEFG